MAGRAVARTDRRRYYDVLRGDRDLRLDLVPQVKGPVQGYRDASEGISATEIRNQLWRQPGPCAAAQDAGQRRE